MEIFNIRQRHIVDFLKGDPAVSVSDLAGKFKVSESTVRRDLSELEKIGVVRRVHGGVILKTELISEPPFEIRKITHRAEKELVGKAAATIVENGMTIFIDGGTTTPFIVPNLRDHQELTVGTVGLNVVNELVSLPSILTIQFGGELHLETQVFAGSLSTQFLESCGLNFDLAFISAAGVTAQYGATNQILDRIPQKQAAIKLSRRIAVVVDGSKLGRVAMAQILPMNEVDLFITDKSAPAEELDEIRKLCPQIILA